MRAKFVMKPAARLGAAAAAGLVLRCATLQAALLAYEPFEFGDVAEPSAGQYALGDENAGTNTLGGQNPTIGPTAFYGGPWEEQSGQPQAVKALPSLSYPNFPAGIGGVQQETVQFDCCSFGRTARPIAGGLGAGRDSRTIFESFLIDFGSQGTDSPGDFGKRGHELWNGFDPNDPDSTLAVDLFLNSFSGNNELALSVTTISESTTVPLRGGGLNLQHLANTFGGTHLVVMKYEFNPTDPDVVSVYLDPLDVNQPGTPDAEISIAASDLFITHHGAFTNFTFSGSGHIPGAIDEIRWGEAYDDVVTITGTIPEPGALALIGIGAVLCAAVRRRGA